jgi:hypothetical protein
VHFAEFRRGVALNPLRPGALGPYTDTTTPLITGLGVPRAGLAIAPKEPLNGRNELVVEVHDDPQLALPSPWNNLTAAPTLVRWRIDSGRWPTVLDVRRVVPKPDADDRVYAYHTHQNRPHRRGHYLIYLARGWDSGSVPAGRRLPRCLVAGDGVRDVRLLEPLDLVRAQRQLLGCDRLLEVLDLRRPDDRRRHAGLV